MKKAALVLLFAASPFALAAEIEMVACAPGYPSTTEQAQPSMDRFAAEASRLSGLTVRAHYTPRAEDGIERIAEAELALIPTAFYLEYRERLALEPLLAVGYENGMRERWSLVVAKESVDSPAALADWKVVGLPGYSPNYVRKIALADYALPASTEIVATRRVLSQLRKAAKGEPLAVLLDSQQSAALDKLPFGDALEVVARSVESAGFLLCAVGGRLDDATRERLRKSLASMHDDAEGAEALAEIRVERFGAFDPQEIATLREAFGQ